MIFTEKQREDLLDLLWDSLKQDPDHQDRRLTGWGTKTTDRLVACIERIAGGDTCRDYAHGVHEVPKAGPCDCSCHGEPPR